MICYKETVSRSVGQMPWLQARNVKNYFKPKMSDLSHKCKFGSKPILGYGSEKGSGAFNDTY